MDRNIKLNDFDLIIINSSAGKDSLAAIAEVNRIANIQKFPHQNIIISHQDLGKVEWPETKELAKKQADHFGYDIVYSKRQDKTGYEENLIEYALRRGKWPSSATRWCTSDFKRGPGARVVTRLTSDMKESKVLYVFGFRAEESPARSKRKTYALNKRLTTNKRTVYDWLPIHTWNVKKVWNTILGQKLPYHYAYKLGMPRLSCVFCIFSPFDALVVAGKENPALLDEYVAVEMIIDHKFKADVSLKEVRQAIREGYEPKNIENWIM